MKARGVLNYSYMHSYIRHHTDDIVQIHVTATLTANIQPLVCTEYEAGLWAVWGEKSIRQNAKFQAFPAVQLRPSLFWDVTQNIFVPVSRRFG